MISLAGIPVHKDPYAAAFYDDGRPRLFTLIRLHGPPRILVHPDRWDAFVMAINQPDVFAHPEVQELLGLHGNSLETAPVTAPADKPK